MSTELRGATVTGLPEPLLGLSEAQDGTDVYPGVGSVCPLIDVDADPAIEFYRPHLERPASGLSGRERLALTCGDDRSPAPTRRQTGSYVTRPKVTRLSRSAEATL